MKALEKLNFILKVLEANIPNKQKFQFINESCKEAIAELEALQNRSCANCKFNIDFKNLTDEEYLALLEKCSKCCIFYDSNWEPK